MKCHYCQSSCIKKGKQKTGLQKYQCIHCRKYQQEEYIRQANHPATDEKIKILTKEHCGVRSISRILNISCTTVIRRTLNIGRKIKKPTITTGKSYQVDELKTFIGKKKREWWIVYALRKDTGEISDFRTGRRTKRTISGVIETLLLSGVEKIYTDGLNLYRQLVPRRLHSKRAYSINQIERKNLDMRTCLKRLCRKTICFSRSIAMLEACLKIYFWS